MHMMIHEAGKIAGLTRKAIEYYIDQQLIFPTTLPNGYRDFSTKDVETLRKIGVLRRLGISTQQIRAILGDSTGQAMRAACVRASLDVQQAQVRRQLLDRLAQGAPYWEISAALDSLDSRRTVIQRLMDAFPGFWGCFLAMHFSGFLDSPIATSAQQQAYDEIIAYLDAAPPLPEDIRQWLDAATEQLQPQQMQSIATAMREQATDPQQMLAQYRRAQPFADEFRATEAGQRSQSLQHFLQQNGYYDIFIPAMRRLSPAYAAYSEQLAAVADFLQTAP